MEALTAEVQADNYAMLHVQTDSGLAARRRWDDGVVELSTPVPRVAALGEASAYLDAVAERDRHADVASLEPLLNPQSVSVVGAGRRPGSIGRTVLPNIRDAGFAGGLYAVSRVGGDIEGIPCIPSVPSPPGVVWQPARSARRMSAKFPVLTVHAGRSAQSHRAAASHTAAAAAPPITRQALFGQAGIIATAGFGELLDAAVLLASQPVPAGNTAAIVSNGGGAGVLAANACVEAGLAVAATSTQARGRQREVLPAEASLCGPVDTTAAVSPEAFGEALHISAGQDGVNALIAVLVQSASAGLLPVLTAAPLPVPAAAVVLDQPSRGGAQRLWPRRCGFEPLDSGGAVPQTLSYSS